MCFQVMKLWNVGIPSLISPLMVHFTVVFTFPVCMNSFLVNFCPFTSSSPSFWVFTFRVFKEFFRGFRGLLFDLDLRNWKGGGFPEHADAPWGSSHKQMSQSLWWHQSSFQSRRPRGNKLPNPRPRTRTQRESGECSWGPLCTQKNRMTKRKYGGNEGCQLKRWPTCGWVSDEGCFLYSWSRRPHPQGFPPDWAPTHSHLLLHCPHWLGDTSKVRETAAQSSHALRARRGVSFLILPGSLEIPDVHTGWNLLLQKYYLLVHFLIEKCQDKGEMS